MRSATRRSPRRWARTRKRSPRRRIKRRPSRNSRQSMRRTFRTSSTRTTRIWGRKKGGRGDFSARFFGDYFGTVNTHGHTTVCQGSLYLTCKAMREQYEYSKFGGGKKFYWQGDFEDSES